MHVCAGTFKGRQEAGRPCFYLYFWLLRSELHFSQKVPFLSLSLLDLSLILFLVAVGFDILVFRQIASIETG